MAKLSKNFTFSTPLTKFVSGSAIFVGDLLISGIGYYDTETKQDEHTISFVEFQVKDGQPVDITELALSMEYNNGDEWYEKYIVYPTYDHVKGLFTA